MKSFEIHGIEQAVVLLMFAFDRIFAHRVKGWRRTRKGYRVEVMPSSRDMASDVMVLIYPIGLHANEHVACRFIKDADEWTAYKGQFSSFHSTEVANFAFDGTNTKADGTTSLEFIITPRSHDEWFKEVLAREAIYECESA